MDDQGPDEVPAPGEDGGPATPATPGGNGAGAPATSGTNGSWRSTTVGGQWPATVADTIESVVAAFRLQVIRPLMLAARGLVFGIIVGTMALVLSVLVSVALVRFMTVYFFDGRVWASYLVLGVLFSAAGVVAWTRRHSPAEDSAEAA